VGELVHEDRREEGHRGDDRQRDGAGAVELRVERVRPEEERVGDEGGDEKPRGVDPDVHTSDSGDLP
jgi:hypothetical protein